jgi:predicted esterase
MLRDKMYLSFGVPAIVFIIMFLGWMRCAAASSSLRWPADNGCSNPALESVTIAGVPVVIAGPSHVTATTPLIVMYHGFGPPNSPQALAKALPPIPGAVTVYPTLPLFGARIPQGGADELARRQNDDYIGQLLFPAMSGAAREITPLIAAITESYGLSKSRPLVIFGFSAGGAAALLGLTDNKVRPKAVLVLNAPLSIKQAVDSFERQTGKQYRWTDAAKEASLRYDIARDADKLARSDAHTAILIVQSGRERGLSSSDASSVAQALKSAFAAHVSHPDIGAVALTNAGHHVLDDSDKDQTQTTRLDTQALITRWLQNHALRQPCC